MFVPLTLLLGPLSCPSRLVARAGAMKPAIALSDGALAPARIAIDEFLRHVRREGGVPHKGWTNLGRVLGTTTPLSLLDDAFAALKTGVDTLGTLIAPSAVRQGLKTVRDTAHAAPTRALLSDLAPPAPVAERGARGPHLAPQAITALPAPRVGAPRAGARVARRAEVTVARVPSTATVVAALQSALRVAQAAPSHLTRPLVHAIFGIKSTLEQLEMGESEPFPGAVRFLHSDGAAADTLGALVGVTAGGGDGGGSGSGSAAAVSPSSPVSSAVSSPSESAGRGRAVGDAARAAAVDAAGASITSSPATATASRAGSPGHAAARESPPRVMGHATLRTPAPPRARDARAWHRTLRENPPPSRRLQVADSD